MDNDRKNIYVLADDRAQHLTPLITPPPLHSVSVKTVRRATIFDLRDSAKALVFSKPCKCIFILGGIHSIVREDTTGYIYLPYDTVEDAVETTTTLFDKILAELDNFTTVPIILCTITGIDLLKANDSTATGIHTKQHIMDQAIIQINDRIVKRNKKRGFDTPMTASAVHRFHSGKKGYRHGYCKLQNGAHPNEAVLNIGRQDSRNPSNSSFPNDLTHRPGC